MSTYTRRLSGAVGFCALALVVSPTDARAQADSVAATRCKQSLQTFVAGDTAPAVAAASAWAGRMAIEARLAGCPAVAVELYELAAEREPSTSVVWLRDAAQLLVERLNLPDSAFVLIERASAARPTDDEMVRLLAKVEEAGHHWSDAHCTWARILVMTDPHDAESWAGLARVAYLSGQPREALADWQRLQLIAPNYLPSDTVAAAMYDRSRATIGTVQPANEWLVMQDAHRCAGRN